MTDYSRICFVPAVLALTICSAQAKEKITTACFYESGQDNGKAISDFSIWNTAAFPIPKGTIVSYTSSGAPNKTFTAKPDKDIAPNDSFSSGGTEPSGDCKAWWLK